MSLLAWYKMNDYMVNFKPSLIDYSYWRVGTKDGQYGFAMNGEPGANSIILDTNPVGQTDVIWNVSNSDLLSDADGGWNGVTNVAIDPTKTYRMSLWVRKKVLGIDGGTYFGPTHQPPIALKQVNDNIDNTNPYFLATTFSTTEWILIIGYVLPHNTTETSNYRYLDSGVYKGGNKIQDVARVFKFAPTSTTLNLRAYHYYCTDPTAVQQFYRPRIDLVDGTEPTLAQLSICSEHSPLILNDSSGNNNHGVIQKFGVGTVLPEIIPYPGKMGYGMKFTSLANNTGGYINTLLKPKLSEFSVQYRLKPTLEFSNAKTILNIGTNLLKHLIPTTSYKHFTYSILLGSLYSTYVIGAGVEINISASYKVISATQTKVEMYINGILDYSTTINACLDVVYEGLMCIGGVVQIDKNAYYEFYEGMMMDFRIYDHIISKKEINDFNNAKILHYTFDEMLEPSRNLWDNINGRPILLTPAGTTQPIVEVIDMDTPFGTEVYKVTIPADNDTGYAGCRLINTPQTMVIDGRPRSFSVYIKGNISNIFGPGSIYVTGGYGIGSALKNPDESILDWHKYEKVNDVTNGAGATPNNYLTIYANVTAAVERVFYVAIIQLEEKDHITPFMTGTRLGGRMVDHSGWGNHAIKMSTNAPYWVKSTSNGKGAYKFNNNNLRFLNPLDQMAANQEWTVCATFSVDNAGITQQLLDIGTALHFTYLALYQPLLWLNSVADNYYTYGVANKIVSNKVYHIAFVFRNSDGLRKIYLDGEDITGPAGPNLTSNPLPIKPTLTIGGPTFTGTIHNFEIYASALSAATIMPLAKNRMAIDDGGNIYVNSIMANINTDPITHKENLFVNGDLSLESNYGFSQFTYNAAERCLTKSVNSQGRYDSDLYIEIPDTNDVYEYEVEFAVSNSNGSLTEKFYIGFTEYDKEFATILALHAYTRPNTRTTLAAPLSPGDTIVYLDSVANWTITYGKLAVYGPESPYPDYYYTRKLPIFTAIDKVANTVTLAAPYDGLYVSPIGTAVQNNKDAGSYNYGIASTNIPPDGVFRKVKLIVTGETEVGIPTNFRRATRYIKFSLSTAPITSTQTYKIRSVRLTNLSKYQRSVNVTKKQQIQNTGVLVANKVSNIGVVRGMIRWFPLKRDFLDYSGVTRDVDNNKLSATVYGTPTFVTEDKNECCLFNGTTDYLSSTYDVINENIKCFTVVLRAKANIPTPSPDGVVKYHGLFGKTNGGSAPDMSFSLDWNGTNASNTTRFFVSDSVDSQAISANTPHSIKFNTIAIVKDYGVMKLYVNGIVVATKNTNIKHFQRDNWPFYIGAAFGSQYLWSGWISDVKVFNRVLAPEEIMVEHKYLEKIPMQMGKDGVYISGDIRTL